MRGEAAARYSKQEYTPEYNASIGLSTHVTVTGPLPGGAVRPIPHHPGTDHFTKVLAHEPKMDGRRSREVVSCYRFKTFAR